MYKLSTLAFGKEYGTVLNLDIADVSVSKMDENAQLKNMFIETCVCVCVCSSVTGLTL